MQSNFNDRYEVRLRLFPLEKMPCGSSNFFCYLLVSLNRADLTRVNYYEFLKSPTPRVEKSCPHQEMG